MIAIAVVIAYLSPSGDVRRRLPPLYVNDLGHSQYRAMTPKKKDPKSIQSMHLKIFVRYSHKQFKREFKLDPRDFWELYKIIKADIAVNVAYQLLFWGATIPSYFLLLMTLRVLAGGLAADIAGSFDVSESYVNTAVHRVVHAIEKRVHNMNFKFDDDSLTAYMKSFNAEHGGDSQMPGTVSCGDGAVFRMHASALNGQADKSSNFCRKGFFAFALQGFCDGSARFQYVSALTKSSTDDGTAYSMSKLHHDIASGKLRHDCHVVLDDGYVCTDQELTPWPASGRKRPLPQHKDAFNYHLSFHRQNIERAWGLLHARFGILNRPLKYKLNFIPKLLSVCCKLHNICIDRRTRIFPFASDTTSGDFSDVLAPGAQNAPVESGQGQRHDLASNRRTTLTQRMRDTAAVRPCHSEHAARMRGTFRVTEVVPSSGPDASPYEWEYATA